MFDSRWDDWHKAREGWYAYPNEQFTMFVARAWGAVPIANRHEVGFLDVGCGTGPNSWFLAREGFSVVAFDGSQTALHATRRRLEGERLFAGYVQGDCLTLPFPDETFDCVLDICTMYINTPEGMEASIKEAHRVLKKGGILHGYTPQHIASKELWEGRGEATFATLEQLSKWLGIFQRAGLARDMIFDIVFQSIVVSHWRYELTK